jgi:hypothetical protein
MSIISNEARCTSCHAGYGWKDATFDFTDMTKIDCLVCHDTTGTLQESPHGGRHARSRRWIWWPWPKTLDRPPARPAGTATSTAAAAKRSSTPTSPASCCIRSAIATCTWAGTIFSAPNATAPATTKSPGAVHRFPWWKAACPAKNATRRPPTTGMACWITT